MAVFGTLLRVLPIFRNTPTHTCLSYIVLSTETVSLRLTDGRRNTLALKIMNEDRNDDTKDEYVEDSILYELLEYYVRKQEPELSV